MNVPRLIVRKRDGGALSVAEWTDLVRAYVAGDVPDYQMSALAMAIVFQGLTDEELQALTAAMLDSGDRLELVGWPRPRIDKHSIGGVGDKTSLLLAPMLASLDVAVPMISGRGLGHTGGTLDKLESIPGFRTDLSLAQARAQLESHGAVMLGQTAELVPADRRLYALRDVTGTVESVPLIAASIMSKKLAESLTGLVLDIKTGSGAFITDTARSLELAHTMIRIGEAHGCTTVAVTTAMDRPLGRACGNALEVREAIDGLRGEGPTDLMEVTYALATEMLLASGRETDRGRARDRVESVVRSGAALERLGRIIAAQGGDRRVVDDPSLLPAAKVVKPVPALAAGIVSRIEPRAVGYAIIDLGGGRVRAGDAIDAAVGVVLRTPPGSRVAKGEPLIDVHAATDQSADQAVAALQAAVTIGGRYEPLPLVGHRITAAGVEPWPD